MDLLDFAMLLNTSFWKPQEGRVPSLGPAFWFATGIWLATVREGCRIRWAILIQLSSSVVLITILVADKSRWGGGLLIRIFKFML